MAQKKDWVSGLKSAAQSAANRVMSNIKASRQPAKPQPKAAPRASSPKASPQPKSQPKAAPRASSPKASPQNSGYQSPRPVYSEGQIRGMEQGDFNDLRAAAQTAARNQMDVENNRTRNQGGLMNLQGANQRAAIDTQGRNQRAAIDTQGKNQVNAINAQNAGANYRAGLADSGASARQVSANNLAREQMAANERMQRAAIDASLADKANDRAFAQNMAAANRGPRRSVGGSGFTNLTGNPDPFNTGFQVVRGGSSAQSSAGSISPSGSGSSVSDLALRQLAAQERMAGANLASRERMQGVDVASRERMQSNQIQLERDRPQIQTNAEDGLRRKAAARALMMFNSAKPSNSVSSLP
jgi:hypothetical protein